MARGAWRSAYDCDVLVIGGGIVGLSTAYAITRAAPGTRVTVLEKEPGPARHQTGRNSGVIHSGIYYRPGSLKARYAVRGAAEMVKFCAEYGIPHEVTGKLIVATERDGAAPAARPGPARPGERHPGARAGPRPDRGVRAARCAGLAAIHVGTTGVCDFGAVAAQLGAAVAGARDPLRRARSPRSTGARRRRRRAHRGRRRCVRARVLVNCAGLHCDRVARLTGDDPGCGSCPSGASTTSWRRPELVRGLVYPVPDPAFPFLGVHLTRGIDGGVHVGPNAVPGAGPRGLRLAARSARASWPRTLAWPGAWRIARRHWRYGAGELRRSLSKRAFTEAVRRLLPAVTPQTTWSPAPAGVRAQAVLRDGTLVDDFLITRGARARSTC